jgi:hypothetical protein
MTDEILDAVIATGGPVFVDARTWDKGPWIIAGLAHLSKPQQLEEWGNRKGLLVSYDLPQNAYVIQAKTRSA